MEKENKHNKRRALYLSTFALCLALSLGVSACSEIPCIYSGEGECSNGVCTDECADEGEKEHVHSYSALNYDESYHWQECSCGEISGKEAHAFETVSVTEGSYDYALGKASDGVKVLACSVCKYETTEPVPNENVYIHENVGESASNAAQRNLDTIDDSEGTYVLTNASYSELYLRVSSKVSTDNSGTYVREVNNLTIKGDGETAVAGLVISSDYYEYTEIEETSLQGGAKTLTEEPAGSLIINNLVIEDINFTSSIRIKGNVTINGLTISNCSYDYPSEYRYLADSNTKLVDVDPSTVGLVYAVNESESAWEDIVITGCEVVEPYYGVYIEGDASVTITDCYFSSYRFVKYLTSENATSTGSANINTYNELICIKPHEEDSISGDISITNNTFQGGFYTKYSSITLSNGSISVDGVGETGSLVFTDNVAGDTVNKDTVVATFSNIATEDFTISDNEYVSPTMGANFSSTFDESETGSGTYKWKVMYADSLYTFDHEEDLLYFCNACWNNGTTLDHASHLDHYHGHVDGASASKDFDAEWDEETHAMILANYYASPYMSFYLDFMDFSQHDYMVSFDLDFSNFKAENGEYVSMACCFAHGSYASMDVEVGYDTDKVVDGQGGFYVTAKAYNGTSWETITHHEADGKVHIEMNFSKDENSSSTGYFTVNVYEGDYEHKGDLVATISSVQSYNVGTNCIQWCPDAGHGVDTDHDGTNDHYGYTEDGDYVEIDNFGFTILENNMSRAVSA